MLKPILYALIAAALCLNKAWADWPLNVITALSQEDPMYQGLLQFQQRVAARTEGEVTVRIFYGSQLGSDEDVLEQARAGANVAVLVDAGRLAVYTPPLGILAAPYLVKGAAESRQLVTSPLFESWVTDLRDAAGLQILAFNWWQGERHLLTHKPIHTPADLAGVRLRTIGAPTFLATIAAMGATPTPIAWAEVYPALQQEVIDGAEAQHPASHGARLYEVISHITKTGHINLMTGLVVGSQWFDQLPGPLQSIVREEAMAAGDHATNRTLAALDNYETQMRNAGVTISNVDTTPFEQATAAVYQELGLADVREQVNRALSEGAQ